MHSFDFHQFCAVQIMVKASICRYTTGGKEAFCRHQVIVCTASLLELSCLPLNMAIVCHNGVLSYHSKSYLPPAPCRLDSSCFKRCGGISWISCPPAGLQTVETTFLPPATSVFPAALAIKVIPRTIFSPLVHI